MKALTSLCAWQNWQDGGWKINHCGVSNQPYYPADDDFRRAGKERDLMCFTMGNCVASEDTNGNRKLLKRRYDHKIDAVAAMMDAYVAYKLNRDAFE